MVVLSDALSFVFSLICSALMKVKNLSSELTKEANTYLSW